MRFFIKCSFLSGICLMKSVLLNSVTDLLAVPLSRCYLKNNFQKFICLGLHYKFQHGVFRSFEYWMLLGSYLNFFPYYFSTSFSVNFYLAHSIFCWKCRKCPVFLIGSADHFEDSLRHHTLEVATWMVIIFLHLV